MSVLLPISEIRRLAAIHGGDPEPVIAARAEKAEALLRQIACNTDAEWARKLARDYFELDTVANPRSGQQCSAAEIARRYARMSGKLYARLEGATVDLEAALGAIPESHKLVRQRLTLRVSATKEVLEQIRASVEDAPLCGAPT